MKYILNVFIFFLQLMGAGAVWMGLYMIWEPLGWIYFGVLAFVYGHLLYRATESEESDK